MSTLANEKCHPHYFCSLKGVFPGYDPPLYTAVEVQASLLWADVDILQ